MLESSLLERMVMDCSVSIKVLNIDIKLHIIFSLEWYKTLQYWCLWSVPKLTASWKKKEERLQVSIGMVGIVAAGVYRYGQVLMVHISTQRLVS